MLMLPSFMLNWPVHPHHVLLPYTGPKDQEHNVEEGGGTLVHLLDPTAAVVVPATENLGDDGGGGLGHVNSEDSDQNPQELEGRLP